MEEKWTVIEQGDLEDKKLKKYVGRVLSHGYRIEYLKKNDNFVNLVIKVFEDSIQICLAQFSENDYDAHCQNIKVSEKYKRQGIGTAMYVLAEFLLQKKIFDFWENKKSSESKAFWNQENRPFGSTTEIK